MRNNMFVLLTLVGIAHPWGAAGRLRADETHILSPNAAVQAKLFVQDGRLKFAVSLGKHAVIDPSPLVFLLDGVDIAQGVEFGPIKTYQVNETYPWRGAHAQAVDHCLGAKVLLRHAPSKLQYTLEIRAYNDGVAFRYVIPGNKESRVPDEAAVFVIPQGSTVWYHDLKGHYEGVHKQHALADVKAGDWAAAPLTFKLPGDAGYASITEAAVVNYSGAALQADGQRGFKLVLGHNQPVSTPFKLRYSQEDIQRLSRPAVLTGPITSPWRVVLVGADLNTLVNADVIHNLCPPPDPKLFPQGMHTQWLKPGRAVWKYLDGGQNSLAGMKDFCRLAGQLGFEHNIVEGFWKKWSDAELKDLVKVGKDNGVGIWLWKHRKELHAEAQRSAFFKKCRDAGVVGVKIDFFDHDHKEVIDLYYLLLREAAQHRLMVDFHGSTKPTGEARTWPNEMVRESVRGMESSKLTTRALHDATLPFTRFLAGHGDYTPVHFGARRADTTWAHQVATAVVFTAPLMLYAAHPQNILDNPCAPLIKGLPTVWDETIVLPFSEISEVAGFARRRGDKWFVGIVNGPTARTMRVPLTFLGKGAWRAMLIHDDKNDPAAVRIEETKVRAGEELSIALSKGGGFVGRFSK